MLSPELPVLTGTEVKDAKGFIIILVALAVVIIAAIALRVIEYLKRRRP